MSSHPEINADATGYVIRGYDPLAYFKEKRPVPGKADLSTEYKGGKYLFSNKENRDEFVKNPEKYAPQYGGFCAFGVSVGKKFDVDPSSWCIVEDKLYLNLNPTILEKWSADTKGCIAKSEKNWPMIHQKDSSAL